MARNGAGVYSLPAGSTVTNGQTTSATQHNTPLLDLQTDANTARPVVAGGTGATTAADARLNLGVGSLSRGEAFATRAALVTWAGSNTPIAGAIYSDGSVSYLGSSGATDISDLAGLVPLGVVTPDHFGAVSDGSADSTSAWQDAVDYADTVVGRPGATYRIDDRVLLSRSGQKIDISRCHIDATNFASSGTPSNDYGTEAVFNALGALRVTTTLSSSAAEGATTISVASATGVTAGDGIYLTSNNEHWYTESGSSVPRSYISKVTAVSGTTLTLDEPLPFGFTTSGSTVTVRVWGALSDITLIAGSVEGPGLAHPTAGNDFDVCETFFHAFQCNNVRLIGGSESKIESFQGAVSLIMRCVDAKVLNINSQGHAETYATAITEGQNSFFTGHYFTECYSIEMDGCTGRRHRHLQDGARSWSATISNNKAYRSHRPAFGSHLGCSDFTYIANTSWGGIGGALWRGWHSTWIGNTFRDRKNTSVASWYDTAGATTDLPRDYIFQGNTFEGYRAGVAFYANINSCDMTGNTILGGYESAGYFPLDVQSNQVKSLKVRGGRIYTGSGGDCVWIDNTTPDTRGVVAFDGVRFENYDSNAIDYRASQSNGLSVLSVKNCDFAPNSGTVHVNTNSQTFAVLDVGPNFDEAAISETPIFAAVNKRATYGGTADAITLTSGAGLTSLATGVCLQFRASSANTGAATINVDGLGAIACRTPTAVALPAGFIRTDVDTVAVYDGTYWVVSRAPEYGVVSSTRYFARFENGMMECWETSDRTADAWTTAVGALYQPSAGFITIAFAQTFAAAPIVTATGIRGTGTSTAGCEVYSVTTSIVNLAPWATASLAATVAKSVSYHAKGAWF